MLDTISTGATAAAFAVAGVDNSLGRAATKADYVRWEYPEWWCYATGGLELATAALVAAPSTRTAGLVLGTAVIGAATVTVVRHREFGHLAPLGLFAGFLAATALLARA